MGPATRTTARCLWCGHELPADAGTIGRRRRYCSQACRQRAYEHRSALTRRDLPADALVLTAAERADLSDRIYQVRCAAEDVLTALTEAADRSELNELAALVVTAARDAERLR